MADQGTIFEGILLKPSMVTPGADCKKRATPEQVRFVFFSSSFSEAFSVLFPSSSFRSPTLSSFYFSLSTNTLLPTGRRLHPQAPAPPRSPRSPRHHVPLGRPVRARGHAEPQRDEPDAQPVARVLLVREGPAELRAAHVAGGAGEPAEGAGGAAGARQGQLGRAEGYVAFLVFLLLFFSAGFHCGQKNEKNKNSLFFSFSEFKSKY